MRSLLYLGFLAGFAAAAPTAAKTYEYIVVGSGPGGAPLAANLARAGHSVLLLEAGDDQSNNPNVTNINNAVLADNDPATRWDFFVDHFADPAIDAEYERTVWRQTNGSFYVGLEPPAGAKRLGVWYPRAGTLGGCAMHNAGVNHLPNDAEWDQIAAETGDSSWKASNMRKYFVKYENNQYLPNGTVGHGFNGYLKTAQLDSSWASNATADGTILAKLAAKELGSDPEQLPALLKRDGNALDPKRDTSTGIFGFLVHADNQGTRSSPAYYVRSTLADAKKYPLTLQLNTLVTKVLFNKTSSSSTPTAIGVEFLQGKSLYGADPRSSKTQQGTKGTAYASKEVILAGGVFNTPQILKLSGIGPAAELKKFNIPVVKDLPGVGTHMSDNYEGGVLALASRPLQNASSYTQIMYKTSAAALRNIYLFCSSFAFEGFWPGFPQSYGPNEYECAMVHYNPSSSAGTVLLRSADPRDMPAINLHYFETGADKDLGEMLEAAKFVRSWREKAPQGIKPWKELHPCVNATAGAGCSDEAQKDYLKKQAYSHHATSTARIGAASDPTAVLDSKFRVRGVTNLRVVDGSAFPRVPGAFPVMPTFMLSEKATDDILAAAAA